MLPPPSLLVNIIQRSLVSSGRAVNTLLWPQVRATPTFLSLFTVESRNWQTTVQGSNLAATVFVNTILLKHGHDHVWNVHDRYRHCMEQAYVFGIWEQICSLPFSAGGITPEKAASGFFDPYLKLNLWPWARKSPCNGVINLRIPVALQHHVAGTQMNLGLDRSHK